MTKEIKVPLSDEQLEQIAGGKDIIVRMHPPKERGDRMISEKEYLRRKEEGEDVSMFSERTIPIRIVIP